MSSIESEYENLRNKVQSLSIQTEEDVGARGRVLEMCYTFLDDCDKRAAEDPTSVDKLDGLATTVHEKWSLLTGEVLDRELPSAKIAKRMSEPDINDAFQAMGSEFSKIYFGKTPTESEKPKWLGRCNEILEKCNEWKESAQDQDYWDLNIEIRQFCQKVRSTKRSLAR
jgi:hypothetical protein